MDNPTASLPAPDAPTSGNDNPTETASGASSDLRARFRGPAARVEHAMLHFEGGLLARAISSGTVTIYRMNGKKREDIITLDAKTLDAMRAMTAFGSSLRRDLLP